MLDVYNRNLKILRTYSHLQAKFSQAECLTPRPVVCPQCRHSSLILYDHYTRKAAFINHEGVRRTLIIKAKRYKCQHCSYLFREPIEGLLPKKRSSEEFRKNIAHEYIKNVNNKTIAREFGLSPSAIERIIHERFHLKIKEALNYPAPLMIGIDEHSIHKGRKFATTIADLGNHRIYDIIEGKSLAQVQRILMSYKNRDKVKMGCMDLSSCYRRHRPTMLSQCQNRRRPLSRHPNDATIRTHQAPPEMKKIGVTIRKWFTPIIRMWRFVQNNGITEGFHRKIKLIQGRAYGFRNFENYRLRGLVECGGFNL